MTVNSATLAPRPWLAATTLAQREFVRFFRQRNRVIGAVGQPILFWLLFASGMNQMFQAGSQSFGEYFIPGTMMLILLFTAIFATISIIEDRREGFLQSVLVSPAPRWAMVIGKILGGASIALLQGLIFLALVRTLGVQFGPIAAIKIAAWMFLSAVALTGLGFVIAWPMESTQGFHAIMNLLLMPMWLLSGAFFPVPTLSTSTGISQLIMHWVMRFNPVTYAVAGLRRLLYAGDSVTVDVASAGSQLWLPSMQVCVAVVLVFALAMVVWSVRMARLPTSGDLLS